MLKIFEASHDKLSGVSSIFIDIHNNNQLMFQNIISIIKSCETYNFNSKTKLWEIPLTKLSYIIDNLTIIDDIELTLLDNDTGDVDIDLKVEPRVKPFKHQVEAVEYGLKNDKWLLLDSPGLGKSLSLIMLAEELKQQRNIKHCLIICGINTLKANWEHEIDIHSHEKSIIIGKRVSSKGTIVYDTMKKRAEQLMKSIDEFFVIINIESLRDSSIVDAILNSPNNFDMMVLDECHKCKGTQALQSQNLLKLKSKYMIGATGTLIMNNPIDAYVPLAWIGKERVRNVTNFKKTYCIFGGQFNHEIIGFKNLDILKDEIDSCSLRRTKDLLDLPSKNIINEYIEMDDKNTSIYNDIKNGVVEESKALVKLNANNVLSMVTRLRQATACPQLLISEAPISSKVSRAIELIEDILSQGDKVVVMSSFKEPIYQLKEMLKKYNPLIGTGDMKDSEVSENIQKFQSDGKYKIFMGTSSKCGTGITLNSASYMIMIDQPWTYALYEQVTDRIHRVNNTHPAFIYNLICKNTIDEQVAKIVDMKEAISSYIIDDKANEKVLSILSKYISDLN